MHKATMTIQDLLTEIGKQISDTRDHRDFAIARKAIEERKSYEHYTLEDLRSEAEFSGIDTKGMSKSHLVEAMKATQMERIERYCKEDDHYTKMLRQLHVARVALEQI